MASDTVLASCELEGRLAGLNSVGAPDAVAPAAATSGAASGSAEWKLNASEWKPVDLDSKEVKGPLRKFYEEQNALVAAFVDSDGSGPGEDEDGDSNSTSITIAVRGSFAINCTLIVAKIFAAVTTGSITVLASALDSLLDIVAGAVLVAAERAIARKDKYQYPEGKVRLESISIVMVACIMILLSAQVVIEAFKVLVGGLVDTAPTIELDTVAIVILVATIVLKFILWIYCKEVFEKTGSMSVEALMDDHLNDVISNSFGIVAVLIAYYISDAWMVDPIGGTLIAFLIMKSWYETAQEQSRYLTGETADPDFLKRLTYIAWNHHADVKEVDTVRAYHMGENFFVEIDLVFEASMPHKMVHDICEDLQIKLEKISEVERAYIHPDWESEHAPEHKTL